MDRIYDLIIVGGGPAGLSGAIYAGRAGRKTLLLEKGSYGGRINDTLEIRNYPGTVSDSGAHLMELFKTHAGSYESVEMKRAGVTAIRKEGELYTVSTKRRGEFSASSVLLDLGTKPRSLGIPGESEFAGHGIAYCATCDGESFKGKEIFVLGSGDQAVEEADYLTRFATKVTIIVLHEEGHLDCNEMAARQAFSNPKISFLWNSTLAEVKGNTQVESIVIKNVVTGGITEVPTSGVFFFVGMVPQTELVRDLVTCDKRGYIVTNDKMETSLPGLYASGDCRQTFLRQVITSAADGAVAATASEQYVKELERISTILSPDSGNIAFLFYNPYENAEIDEINRLEQELGEKWKVYRQDVTRQSLLYKTLELQDTVSLAFYENGRLLEKKSNQGGI